jgi:cobyrinic acid a,c-diamide synthase
MHNRAWQVLGCLPSDRRVEVKERLLGLLPPSSGEGCEASAEARAKQAARLAALQKLLEEHLDIDALRAVAARAAVPPAPPAPAPPAPAPPAPAPRKTTSALPPRPLSPAPIALPPVRIAVARDEAFCFVYHENLRRLRRAGATLLFFSPLRDKALPHDADGLYLVGGYPELHAPQLAANGAMRAAVRAFCQGGGFCLAECGGLMYLAQALHLRPTDVRTAAEAAREVAGGGDGGGGGSGGGGGAEGGACAEEELELTHEMCGLLPFDVSMSPRMTMGYCVAALRSETAALLGLPEGCEVRCQQYHFSEATLDGEPAERVDSTGHGAGLRGVTTPAFDVLMQTPRARPAPEGAVLARRTVASYCHLHLGSDARLAPALVRAARRGQRVVSLLPQGTEMVAALLAADEAAVSTVGVPSPNPNPNPNPIPYP